ncbi:Uncharacterised protein [Zhongshania aliphaticivorans]|uniref:Lipid/polyisoprenoid-binding YceI-like domain-containing protein n=1 Tax=Zhongshania aliphaticivorans TaxID=1470434 RepID=A0A5S9NFM8_9GAMM|nr:YceI family protein [Zhongshania aliphaticivorans]CAA0089256.1 Uncharacterised protein [Zhongshania aliphaticivorans]CAA0095946.1 Uncharacterised protein [Zhongshania aliphaticivorans]
MRKLVCTLVFLLPFTGLNALELDKASSKMNFVTVKNDSVAELMSFTSIDGTIDDESGMAELKIDLSSVASGVDIRNENMRKYLFQVDEFTTAIYTAKLDMAALTAMAEGDQQQMLLDGNLDLHGKSASIKFDVIVTKRADGSYHAITAAPAFVNANSFDLAKGIGKLRSLVRLASIDLVVPVTFSVVFK